MTTQHIPSTFARAAFPLGGIGTGTVSLGARGGRLDLASLSLRGRPLPSRPHRARMSAKEEAAWHS